MMKHVSLDEMNVRTPGQPTRSRETCLIGNETRVLAGGKNTAAVRIEAADRSITVAVGIGEAKTSRDPLSTLVAYGLGSCVGVCLYDPVAGIGGLAHVMLPSSTEAFNNEVSTRFADRAIPALLDEMKKKGASQHRMVAKIAGGARMLTSPALVDALNVGGRNVDAVKVALERCGLSLRAADVGGNQGRTVFMQVGTGKVLVRRVGERETEL